MASPAATCLGRGGMVLLGRFGGGKEIVGSGRRKKHAPAAAAHHAEAGKTGTRRQAGAWAAGIVQPARRTMAIGGPSDFPPTWPGCAAAEPAESVI